MLGRAAMQATGNGIIGLADIPAYVRRMETPVQEATALLQVSSLDDVERQTILITAQSQRGNVSRMAQALGVSRTTLWRKLKSHGINPEEYRR